VGAVDLNVHSLSICSAYFRVVTKNELFSLEIDEVSFLEYDGNRLLIDSSSLLVKMLDDLKVYLLMLNQDRLDFCESLHVVNPEDLVEKLQVVG